MSTDALAAYLELPLVAVNQDDPESPLSMFFYAKINSLDIPTVIGAKDAADFPLHVGALKRSLEESGRYPLFLCECGLEDCGATYVDVFVEEGAVSWRGFFARDESGNQSVLSREQFRFEKAAYQALIRALAETADAFGRHYGPDRVAVHGLEDAGAPSGARRSEALPRYASFVGRRRRLLEGDLARASRD